MLVRQRVYIHPLLQVQSVSEELELPPEALYTNLYPIAAAIDTEAPPSAPGSLRIF